MTKYTKKMRAMKYIWTGPLYVHTKEEAWFAVNSRLAAYSRQLTVDFGAQRCALGLRRIRTSCNKY